MKYFVALMRLSRFTILAVHREANAFALHALSPVYRRAHKINMQEQNTTFNPQLQISTHITENQNLVAF